MVNPIENRGVLMGTITEFDVWLDEADLEGHEEIYALYRAITDKCDFGIINCSENNGKLFIKTGQTENTLMLVSSKATDMFIKTIYKRFDIDGDIEGWYGFKRNMAKDD